MAIDRYSRWIRLALKLAQYILTLLLDNGGSDQLARIIRDDHDQPPTTAA